jgi:ATPase family associated with various cellular activities (AAA)
LSIKAGLRACEIAGLEWSMALDARGKVADILAIHDAIAKKRGGRRIPMHPDLRHALRSLLRISEPFGPVIRSARGGYLRPTSVVNWFAALFKELGFEGCLEGADESDLQPFLKTRSERRELCEAGRLAELGLIQVREGTRLSPVVRRLLSLPRFNARRVGHLLLGEPARASLTWNQFEHLGDLRDIAARIVAASVRSRGSSCRGANILFYGPPGTGKSEFAKTLGAQVGFSVHFCGETDDENAEPNRRDRIAALLIANAIGRVARRTMVVVDEADDLLFDLDDNGAFGRQGSKVFMNRLLERIVAPTIWIVNDIDRLGPSIIRRMNLALRFPKPTLSARKSMIARIATHVDLRLQDSEMLDLARAPGVGRGHTNTNASSSPERVAKHPGVRAVPMEMLGLNPPSWRRYLPNGCWEELEHFLVLLAFRL